MQNYTSVKKEKQNYLRQYFFSTLSLITESSKFKAKVWSVPSYPSFFDTLC